MNGGRAEDGTVRSISIVGKWLVSGPLLLIAIIATGVLTGFWEPNVSIQPSVVGMLWAGTFLSGYLVGSVGRGQMWSAVVALPVTWANQWAFEALTDFGRADSLMLTAMLSLAGWATTILDPRAIPFSAPVCRRSRRSRRKGHRWRWSIWEIGFLTAIVACLAQASPRLESSNAMKLAVAAALLSGLIFSWLACRWAWKDDWNLLSFLGLASALATGLAILFFGSPSGLSFSHWLAWLISGPVNVVAAQGVCVLATLGLWRQAQPKPPDLTIGLAEACSS